MARRSRLTGEALARKAFALICRPVYKKKLRVSPERKRRFFVEDTQEDTKAGGRKRGNEIPP